MKPFGKSYLNHVSLARLLLVASLVFAGLPAWAHSNATATPAPGGSPGHARPKFDVPIPPGHDAEGVTLPYVDIRGHLQEIITIKKAERTDEQHLSMLNADMQTYDDKGAPDANVFMTRSVLDLDTRIVTSDVPVLVRRSDFFIVGQKMVFNTQTRIGHMSGHVRMVISNRQEMAHAAPSPTPASSPSPAAQLPVKQPAASPQ